MMKIFKKYQYKKDGVEHKIKYFFGVPYAETKITEINGKKNKTHHLFPWGLGHKKIDKNKPFFYLKVNSMDFITIPCLQHWLDTIHAMDGDFIIVCDKPLLKQKILEQCKFYDFYPKFIKSYIRPLKKITDNICRTNVWRKATYAHLTTIYHAHKYGIKNFWNIDADDTMIFLSPERTAELLSSVIRYAEKNKIDAFSLDMHESETSGTIWTWGVTYLRDSFDWMKSFANIQNRKWSEIYLSVDSNIGSDAFMDYLRKNHLANNKSFYAEDLYFCHYANLLTWSIGEALYHWKNGMLYFPLLKTLDVHNLDRKISENCEKIDFQIKNDESLLEAQQKFLHIKRLDEHQKNWAKHI